MKTKFLILGSGFAGLTLARKLAGEVGGKSITLVSRNEYFVFTPNLYEVATAEEELESVQDLKKSITVSIPKVMQKLGVTFIQSEVRKVDFQNKVVTLANKTLEFENIICALGSESEYFGIVGAKENALPLKSLEDALRIKNAIEFAVQAARTDIHKKILRIVVAGGGYTGVELAGELSGFLDHVAWKNGYPREKIEILVIEGMGELIPGLDSRLSIDAAERLRELGVRLSLNSLIAKVEPGFVSLKNGERVAFDTLIWTAGIRANEFFSEQLLERDPKHRVKVNQYLQLEQYPFAYVLGDGCCMVDKNGKMAPPTAQDAIDQAEYLGGALPGLVKNTPPAPYTGLSHGYVVMVGGQWAILKHGSWYMKGRLAYFAKQFAHFLFFAKLIGYWNAAELTIFQVKIYSRND